MGVHELPFKKNVILFYYDMYFFCLLYFIINLEQ